MLQSLESTIPPPIWGLFKSKKRTKMRRRRFDAKAGFLIGIVLRASRKRTQVVLAKSFCVSELLS